MKRQVFNIKGMIQDLDPAKSDNKQAYEIRNLRLTAQENSTLLALSTEKGNIQYPIYTQDGSQAEIRGTIIGHCVLSKYVVIFTVQYIDKVPKSYIYRLEERGDTEASLTCVQLFAGDLGFTSDMTLETIGIYENENLQKVYWIDGVHQPRVINIVKDTYYNSTDFDFIPELNLTEKVTIERISNSNGVFSPGTIQYAFTYYNKNGSESNIFYTTELNYISHSNRGASPEDSVSNAFKIKIQNLDDKFDYVRVYSIHRSSINSTPQVKQVVDIPIADTDYDNNFYSFEYIDTNTIGSIVDPTLLLYIGGKDIIAQTMEVKGNTLFFGNIKYTEPNIDENIKDIFREVEVSTTYREIEVSNLSDLSDYYHYSNQLQYGNTSTFKCGECYRLGVQLQYKNGNWSEPIFIQDYEVAENMRPSLSGRILKLPQITVSFTNLNAANKDILQSYGYKKLRTIIVFPKESERNIIAQGIVNPTVFKVGNRLINAPFSQASWFFRPFISESLDSISNSTDINLGSIIEFRHQYCLHTPLKNNTSNSTPYARSSEIQNMYECLSLSDVTEELAEGKSYLNKAFYVDSSIVTFHSPDIEFNQAISLEGAKLRIVGISPINSNVGDIDIQTVTPKLKSSAKGFYHQMLISKGARQLTSGFFYMDGIKIGESSSDEDNNYYGFLIFPWHRTGSLNNDVNSKTSGLGIKCISNIKFSKDTIWVTNYWTPENDKLLDCKKVLDIDQVNLVNLNVNSTSIVDTMSYYGNIDSILESRNYPNAWISQANLDPDKTFLSPTILEIENSVIDDTIDDKYKDTTDPIRMRYKTMPHAVIAFDTYSDGDKLYQEVLPTVNSNNQVWNNFTPFWEREKTQLILSDIRLYSTTIEKTNRIESTPRETCQDILYEDANHKVTLYTCGEGGGRVQANYTISNPPNVTKYKVESDDKIELYDYVLKVEYKIDEDGNRIIDEGNSKYVLTKTREILRNTLSYGGVQQTNLNLDFTGAGLFLCELYRDNIENRFGGTSKYALQQNLWLPANTSINIDDIENSTLEFKYGDTWYQRYDCLKTIPWSIEDPNQIVDICSFMCETRINIDGRYDINRGLQSNLHINNTNFNLFNEVYTQEDNFFTYHCLPEEFNLNLYPNQIMWSKSKIYGNEIDDWTQIIPSSSLDLDGTLGEIRALRLWNDSLLALQDHGIARILYKEQTAISTSTGVPLEIANSGKVDGSQYISNQIGCSNKNTIRVTQEGIYFADDSTKEIYKWSKGLESLSKSKGFNTYFYKNKVDKTFYDPTLKDVYFKVGNECLVYNEQLGEFTSFLDYDMDFMFTLNSSLISIQGNTLWKQFAGEHLSFFGIKKGYSIEAISAEYPTEDKIFSTIEFRTSNNETPFNKIRVWNDYQDTGEVNFERTIRRGLGPNLTKKFRIWRGDIPRVQGKPLERIRNPWTRFKLLGNDSQTVIHDFGITYF